METNLLWTDQGLYQADSDGKWRCLSNPEIVLDFKQINDDYCDCPDGSDEPGTSACPNGKFYCENKGHEPSYIKASQVNDGVCDYVQCCDGSDEWNTPVDCPNRCQEIHDEHVKKVEADQKTYKIGAGKLEKILKGAKRQRDKLESELESFEAISRFLGKELQKKKDALAEAEAKGELGYASLEVQPRINKIMETVKTQVTGYFGSITMSTKNLEQLTSILGSLTETFNENLNDAAVKSAVDTYAEHLSKYGTYYTNEKAGKSIDEVRDALLERLDAINFSNGLMYLKKVFDNASARLKKELEKHDSIIERTDDLENILNYLINNYNPNFNDPNVKQAVQSYQDYLSNKETYKVPAQEAVDWIQKKYEEVEKASESMRDELSESSKKDAIQELPYLEKLKYKYRKIVNDFLGIETKMEFKARTAPPPESKNSLQAAVEELEKDFNDNEKSVKSLKEDLSKNYGPNDILRPFKDVSIQGHIGEYDYELFFIGDIHQKGTNHNVKIGSFSDVQVNDISDTEHQLIITYENGARCWNGPLRKGVVTVDCGAENELLAVTEPEKCEYHFRVKAPIGCKINNAVLENEEDSKKEVHDELWYIYIGWLFL